MKTKINVMIMIVLMLVAMCTSVVFADTSIPIDYTHEAADYFPNVSLSTLNEGDLGDESTSIDLLVGLAALVMAGTVVVHKKRKSIQ